VFTPIVESLITAFGGTGVGEANTFRVLSAVFFAVCTAGCLFLKNPPEGYMSQGSSNTAVNAANSLSPSLTADLFGAKHMATNYGFVLLGFGSGAIISSQIAGYYKNVAAEDINLMFPAFVIASCCAALGIVLMLILRAVNKKVKSQE